MEDKKIYSVRFDGIELFQVTLTPEEYKTQNRRDHVRRGIAATYKIPAHYIRLHDIEDYIFVTDMETGITTKKRKELCD
jgi:hypothetical protein